MARYETDISHGSHWGGVVLDISVVSPNSVIHHSPHAIPYVLPASPSHQIRPARRHKSRSAYLARFHHSLFLWEEEGAQADDDETGDFLLPSLVIAFVLYILTNRLLLSPSVPHAAASDNRVEFTYAFDVAVNSFFPAFLTVYIGLIPLAPVVTRNNWVCLFFGKSVMRLLPVMKMNQHGT